jgi:hypothetical protein
LSPFLPQENDVNEQNNCREYLIKSIKLMIDPSHILTRPLSVSGVPDNAHYGCDDPARSGQSSELEDLTLGSSGKIG